MTPENSGIIVLSNWYIFPSKAQMYSSPPWSTPKELIVKPEATSRELETAPELTESAQILPEP
jgi:hypothetical protein